MAPDRALRMLRSHGVYLGIAVLLLANIAITSHFLSGENVRTQAVRVAPVLLLVYAACGALAAVVGVLATARLTASDPTSLGTLMELCHLR
ncbi:hypothetical protein RB200_05805 [Streptomyces sp. PmtG]